MVKGGEIRIKILDEENCKKNELKIKNANTKKYKTN